MMKNGLIVEHNTKRWYKDGKLHREDGPAIEWADGVKDWYYKDIWVGGFVKPDPVLWERLTSVELNGGPLLNGCVVTLQGNKYWYKDDRYHREDGPAIEWVNGKMDWHHHGEYLGTGTEGFLALWDRLTDEQRGSTALLRWRDLDTKRTCCWQRQNPTLVCKWCSPS